MNYSCRFKYDLSIVPGSLNTTPGGMSRPRDSVSVVIMIASDHNNNRDPLKSKPSKTPSVFDGFDFLLARLHPSYGMPSVQRARRDELYKSSWDYSFLAIDRYATKLSLSGRSK